MLLQLTAGPFRLLLVASSANANWVSVVASWDDKAVRLGADVPKVILTRLLEGLDPEDRGRSAGHIDGDPVTWVASLAENHCAIYRSQAVPDVVIWHFQDADAQTFGSVRLDAEATRRWRDSLEAWLRGLER